MYRAGAWTAGTLPPWVTRRAATGVGLAAARLPVPKRTALGRGLLERRAMVASHLRRVYASTPSDPTSSEKDLARQVDETFVSYARYWAESLRLPSLTQAELAATITVHGLEHLDQALAAGRGVIAALPHLGGWDWGGRWIAGTGRRATVVVEPLRPPEVFEWFVQFRRQSGLDVVAVGPGAGAAGLAALAANHILCLLCDRIVGDASGIEVEFFGERTMLPAGPVTLALRAGVPVVPIAAYFGQKGDEHLIEMRPPLELVRRGRLRDDVRVGTQLLAHELEVLIRKAPTQWHLLRPNWPSDYRSTPDGAAAPRR
jgi:lauroyl/myristoyl acyltransferase